MPPWISSGKGRKTRNECVLLKEHVKYCKTLKPQRVSYDIDDVSTEIDLSEKKSTEDKYQAHTPASYFTKFVSIVPAFSLPEQEGFEFPQQETYVGEDAAEHYLDYVQQVANAIYEKYIKNERKLNLQRLLEKIRGCFRMSHL